jgi:homoserine kinase type II
MPGEADYHRAPNRDKLTAAMQTLASFHLAASCDQRRCRLANGSPGIARRLDLLVRLIQGGCQVIAGSIAPAPWPELEVRARGILRLFHQVASPVLTQIKDARNVRVHAQPVIRDIWHDHVLFTGDEVSGLIDFGAMQNDCVSTDIARLLGSLVGDDADGWKFGLDAYRRERSLTTDEESLVRVFDASTVLLSGMNWLQWIYVEKRHFDQRATILARLDVTIGRLKGLVARGAERGAGL